MGLFSSRSEAEMAETIVKLHRDLDDQNEATLSWMQKANDAEHRMEMMVLRGDPAAIKAASDRLAEEAEAVLIYGTTGSRDDRLRTVSARIVEFANNMQFGASARPYGE